MRCVERKMVQSTHFERQVDRKLKKVLASRQLVRRYRSPNFGNAELLRARIMQRANTIHRLLHLISVDDGEIEEDTEPFHNSIAKYKMAHFPFEETNT